MIIYDKRKDRKTAYLFFFHNHNIQAKMFLK